MGLYFVTFLLIDVCVNFGLAEILLFVELMTTFIVPFIYKYVDCRWTVHTIEIKPKQNFKSFKTIMFQPKQNLNNIKTAVKRFSWFSQSQLISAFYAKHDAVNQTLVYKNGDHMCY